jgi:type IV pilus assembly protein PilY1
VANLRTDNATGFASLLTALARRQVDFIRGADQASEMVAGYALNATRARSYTESGVTYTWRLGDIVYSTPTVVGKPSENYHLLYEDDSYGDFLKKYRNRRQVVYVGANDGMLHAFNGGFFNSTDKSFCTTYSGETDFD